MDYLVNLNAPLIFARKKFNFISWEGFIINLISCIRLDSGYIWLVLVWLINVHLLLNSVIACDQITRDVKILLPILQGSHFRRLRQTGLDHFRGISGNNHRLISNRLARAKEDSSSYGISLRCKPNWFHIGHGNTVSLPVIISGLHNRCCRVQNQQGPSCSTVILCAWFCHWIASDRLRVHTGSLSYQSQSCSPRYDP